ncbi:hypothetical protein EDF56_105342 [Novosphingobium sp. PhB165]|uniref:hypothetical protein n=1 Tax=Novosphingobium sp. PhB165 TaxID=2485105 RepID=UPI00104C5AB4|nr:hypothetical protein [Novosphingobium sp. PhB165]TCM17994.1 hypothetical protein EDF56_105342 [Novosphingobium sp. PhB165]
MARHPVPAELVDLVLRPDVDPYAFVAMDDFSTSGSTTCASDDPRIVHCRNDLVPYAVDWKRRQLLFTAHPARDFAHGHAFLYQAQREQAKRGVLLSFDALPGLFPDSGVRPTFLFSIGRCGSTLAADLLDAVDMASASEPGVYEQFVAGRRMAWLNRSDRAIVLRATTRALSGFLGEPLVVKLRSQCTLAAQEIARATQGRCVMILRALEPWAMSTYRAFGKWPDNRPDELAWRYAKAIKVFHALAREGHRPELVWYEDMLRDLSVLLRAVAAGQDLSEAQKQALAATYGRDSQEGLSIGRAGSRSTMCTDILSEFRHQWERLAPSRLLERYGIADRV